MQSKSYIKLEDGKFKVKSFTDRRLEYLVDAKNMTCTCYVFTHKGIFCKHIDFILELWKK